MLGERVGVDPLVVVDGSGVVEHRPQRGPQLHQQPPGPSADVAESDETEAHLVEFDAQLRQHLLEHVHDSLAGRLVSAERSAHHHGLAGDDAQRVVAIVLGGHLGVGVGKPSHDLGVGAHVRGGNVVIRPDLIADRRAEPAGDPHQLVAAEIARVALDPALAAAEGDPHQRTFHRHQDRQRLDVVQVDVRVVANAALVRPQRIVVLHPIALEKIVVPVVHEHRKVHHDLVVGLGKNDLLMVG